MNIVTDFLPLSKDGLLHGKRRLFALPYMAFCNSKDAESYSFPNMLREGAFY